LCSVFSGDAPLAAAVPVVVAAVSVIDASLPATSRGQVGAVCADTHHPFMTEVGFTPGGIPETVLDREARRRA
jgi:hypothetical protein